MGTATLAHDSVLTPMDVVKQRLQLGMYSGTFDCVRKVWRQEGTPAFFRSLPTTLAMNVPYMGLMVAMNESLKTYLHLGRGADNSLVSAPWYFFSAGIRGAVAAAVTLPLDNVKTRLQTQTGPQGGSCSDSDAADRFTRRTSALRYRGIYHALQVIKMDEGPRGFFRGLAPRVMLAMPAAGICWGTS